MLLDLLHGYIISCLPLQIVGCLVFILEGGDNVFDSPPRRLLCPMLLLWIVSEMVMFESGTGKW